MIHTRRPPGGALHANATNHASCLPFSFRSPPRRGRSFKAPTTPVSTHFWRVRASVDKPTGYAAAITLSLFCSSPIHRIWAPRTRRADVLPPFVSPSNSRVHPALSSLYTALPSSSSSFSAWITLAAPYSKPLWLPTSGQSELILERVSSEAGSSLG